jgi:acetyl-CoA C-acetyltransferase
LSQDIVNLEGGAIARGHPIGATETVLTARLIHSKRRDGLERSIVTLCIGGDEDIGHVLETIA